MAFALLLPTHLSYVLASHISFTLDHIASPFFSTIVIDRSAREQAITPTSCLKNGTKSWQKMFSNGPIQLFATLVIAMHCNAFVNPEKIYAGVGPSIISDRLLSIHQPAKCQEVPKSTHST
jgi:hypothetical protein